MSKVKQCFFYFLILATIIAFFCEISVPLIIYSHISSIRDRMDQPMMGPGNMGNASTADIPIRQLIDDNIHIFICLAGITMFFIGVLLLACRKVRVFVAVPQFRRDAFKDRFKLMEKKAIIANLERMHAKFPIPPPPKCHYYV